MKKLMKWMAAAVLGVLAAAALCVGQPGKKAEAATLPVAYLGIDVSSYQGSIDWSQVAASGVTFTMVRDNPGGGGTGCSPCGECHGGLPDYVPGCL